VLGPEPVEVALFVAKTLETRTDRQPHAIPTAVARKKVDAVNLQFNSDQLPAGVPLGLQPVGESDAPGPVAGVLEDGIEEGITFRGHGFISSDPGEARQHPSSY
jgi:hypothetical protein